MLTKEALMNFQARSLQEIISCVDTKLEVFSFLVVVKGKSLILGLSLVCVVVRFLWLLQIFIIYLCLEECTLKLQVENDKKAHVNLVYIAYQFVALTVCNKTIVIYQCSVLFQRQQILLRALSTYFLQWRCSLSWLSLTMAVDTTLTLLKRSILLMKSKAIYCTNQTVSNFVFVSKLRRSNFWTSIHGQAHA